MQAESPTCTAGRRKEGTGHCWVQMKTVGCHNEIRSVRFVRSVRSKCVCVSEAYLISYSELIWCLGVAMLFVVKKPKHLLVNEV